MTKPLTAFMLSAFFALFLVLFAGMFVGTQAVQFDTGTNLTTPLLDAGVLNETVVSGSEMYDDFQSSASDQTSQISLFKNAPGTIKKETRLGISIFGKMFQSAYDQYLPVWVITIVFVIFLLVIIAMLIRMATGQTL